jgi:hypothetical protein
MNRRVRENTEESMAENFPKMMKIPVSRLGICSNPTK